MSLHVSQDEQNEPATKGDLVAFGEQLEHDLTGKAARFGIGVIGASFLLAMAGAWYASSWRGQVERRVDVVESRVHDMDANGTDGLHEMRRQLDSLRFEMRVLPERIVRELERRGR